MSRRFLPSGERFRLTALYGGLLVALCGMTVAVVYAVLQQGMQSSISRAVADAQPARSLHQGQRILLDAPQRAGVGVPQVVNVASEAALVDRIRQRSA